MGFVQGVQNSLQLFQYFLKSYRETFQSLSYTIPTATLVSIGQKRSSQPTSELRSPSSKRMVLNDRLSWPALLRADNKELARMVAGLNNTVKALNDYLMELLQDRDVLHSQQDEMLEHISELTDNLLQNKDSNKKKAFLNKDLVWDLAFLHQ